MPHPSTPPSRPQPTEQPRGQPTVERDPRAPNRVYAGSAAEGVAPWTFRQTLMGAALTLLPWLALALALAAAPQSAAGQPSHRLAPTLDAASGVLIFVVSAALEGVFTLAPLYFALRMDDAPAQPANEHETTRVWQARLRRAGERLGLTGWASFDVARPRAATEGAASAIGDAPVALAERTDTRWRTVWLTLGLAAATLAVSALYSYALTVTHAPFATNSDALAQQAQTAPLTTLGSLLAAVLIAPICEEVFFRAFLFRGLLRGMPLWPAILLSSLLFALAHADPGSFIPLLIIGIALAFARSRARSLWPSVAIHTINNLVAALLILPTLIAALGK